MLASDADAILAIEREAFPYPWDDGDLAAVLDDPDCRKLVAEDAGQVVAHIVYSTAGRDAEIMTLAVRASHRRRGIGRRLVASVQLGREHVFAEVSDANLGAQLFLRACGLFAYQIVPGESISPTYAASGWDAYTMVGRPSCTP